MPVAKSTTGRWRGLACVGVALAVALLLRGATPPGPRKPDRDGSPEVPRGDPPRLAADADPGQRPEASSTTTKGRPDAPAQEQEAFEDAEVVSRVEAPPDANGRIRRTRILRTRFKYPLVCVEETIDREGRLADRAERVADHVIVRLQPGATERDLAALVALRGMTVRRKLRSPGLYLVALPAADADAVPRAVAWFQRENLIVGLAEPDPIVRPTSSIVPNDPRFGELYGLRNTGQTGGAAGADIGAPEAWTRTTGSRSVVVGVIDTGIDYKHPDLRDNIWVNPREIPDNGVDDDGNGYVDDVRGWDFYYDDNDPMDDHLHGTHVAGTIAASGNNGEGVSGVCWSASLVAIKFLGEQGGTASDAVEAIDYATSLGVTLTSNSWGGRGFSQILYDAVDRADQAGILFVAAAGNSDVSNDEMPHYPAAFDHPNLIAVAATDPYDRLADFFRLDGTRGSGSNWGPTTVDLGAPGSRILSTFPTYRTAAMEQREAAGKKYDPDFRVNTHYDTISGTSMACPQVSGAAALLKAWAPELRHYDLRDAIVRSAQPLSSLAGKVASGGRLNVDRAFSFLEASVLVARGYRVDDTSGNGDGLVNPGEEIRLRVEVRNIGAAPATGVQATLSATTTDVVFPVATVDYGDIAARSDAAPGASFVIRISGSASTPGEIALALTLRDAGGRGWVESLVLPVYRSYPVRGTVRLDGAPLADAVLHYSGPLLAGSVQTRADGAYVFGATEGDCDVFVSKGDFLATATRRLSVSGPLFEIDFVFTTATVGGRARTTDGTGIPGASVSVRGFIQTALATAADGSYSFTRVLGRRTTLLLTAGLPPDYADSAPVEVTLPPDRADVDFVLGKPKIRVEPSSFEVSAGTMGEAPTRTIRVTNTGASGLRFHLDSAAEGSVPGTRVREMAVPGSGWPNSLAYDGRYLWIGHYSNVLTAIDPLTGSVVRRLTLRDVEESGWITWDGSGFWVGQPGLVYKNRPETLHYVDPVTGRSLRQFRPGFTILGLAAAGNRLYAIGRQFEGPVGYVDRLYVANPETFEVLNRMDLPAAAKDPRMLHYAQGALWTVALYSYPTNTIYKLSPLDARVLGTLPGPQTSLVGMVVEETGLAWFARFNDDVDSPGVFWLYDMGNGGWLTPAASTGILGPGQSTDIAVAFASTKSGPGKHRGTVRVVSNDADTPAVDVPVTFDAGVPHWVRGQVTRDGAPFPGVTVSYVGPFNGRVATGPDGGYAFPAVAGTYTLTASAPNAYPSAATSVAVAADVAVPDIAFVTARIRGRVYDVHTGQGVASSASLSAEPLSLSTNAAADGSYAFTVLYGQPARATLSGYDPRTHTWGTPVFVTVPPDASNVALPAGRLDPEIDVTPASIAFDFSFGGIATQTLRISNGGGGELNFALQIERELAFISATPTQGVVPSGGWTDVVVKMAPLWGGFQSGALKIHTNDPDEAVVTVPVTANVRHPFVSVSPTSLSARAQAGESVTLSLTVRNTDTQSQRLSFWIWNSGPWLRVSPQNVFLEPNASAQIAVTLDGGEAGVGAHRAGFSISEIIYGGIAVTVPVSFTVTPRVPVTIVADDASAREPGSDVATFTVARGGSTAERIVVSYDLAGTATEGTDFALSAPSRSVEIPAGAASATLTLTPLDDPYREGDETVVLTLTRGSGYVLGAPSNATATIADDEDAEPIPTVTLTATVPRVSESAAEGVAAFTIARSGATTAPVLVRLAVEGTASPQDYVAMESSARIPAGASSIDVRLAPRDDARYEGDETVVVKLIAAPDYVVGNPDAATITIADDETPPDVDVSPAALHAEAYPEQRVARTLRIANTGGAILPFTVQHDRSWLKIAPSQGEVPPGSAVELTAEFAAGALPPGTLEGTLRIETTGDPDEPLVDVPLTFVVRPFPLELSTAALSADAEAGETVTRALTIRNRDAVPLSLSFVTTAGWMIVAPANATIEPGASLQLTVTFDARSLTPYNYWGMVEIRESASGHVFSTVSAFVLVVWPTPTVTVEATDASASETGSDPGVFTITRTGPTDDFLFVFLDLGGMAAAHTDFPAPDTLLLISAGRCSLLIPAGRSSLTVTITPYDDPYQEGDETVVATLAPMYSYRIGDPAGATVIIADNADTEPLPTVRVTSTRTRVPENTSAALFTITRTGSTTVPLAVSYSLEGTAWSSDYAPASTNFILPEGVSSKEIWFWINRDWVPEGDESIVLRLLENPAYALGTPATATVTIEDDDLVVQPRALDLSATPGQIVTSTLTLRNNVTFRASFQSEIAYATAETGWLTATPPTGFLVRESIQVTVSADAGLLGPGVYNATLRFLVRGVLEVPVRLTVLGPDIEVSPASLSATARSREVRTRAISIANRGTAPLNFRLAVRTTASGAGALWIRADAGPFTVAPGSSLAREIRLDAAVAGYGRHSGSLIVSSDDPDEPEVAVPVSLYVTNAPDIRVRPTSLNVTASPGDIRAEQVAVENVGTAPLTCAFWPGGSSRSSALALPARVARVFDVASDGPSLWVSHLYAASSLDRLDAATGARLGTINLAGRVGPVGGIAHDGEFLWVAEYASSRIYAVHPSTGKIVKVLATSVPGVRALETVGDELYALAKWERKIYRLSKSDGSVLGRIPLPAAFGAATVYALTRVDDALWCAVWGHRRLYKLDPRDGHIVSSVPAPRPYVTGLAARPNGVLWAASYFDRRLYRTAPLENSWLEVRPSRLTLNREAATNVDLYLNAARAGIGAHTGTILIASNDPDAPLVQVAVGFTVARSGGLIADGEGPSSPNALTATVTLNGVPWDRLEDALAAARPGDTVAVGAGVLDVPHGLVLFEGVKLRGVAPHRTVLRATESVPVLRVLPTGDPRPASIETITLTGGRVGLDVGNAAASVTNVQVVRNAGEGVVVGPYGRLEAAYLTVVDNRGHGVAAYGSARLRACVVARNGGLGLSGGADVAVSYSDFFENLDVSPWTGREGNLAEPVPFEDPAAYDYRERAGSATSDAGPPGDPYDREPAPNGGRANMGAFGNTPYATTTIEPAALRK